MRDIEIVRAAEATVVIALHGEHDLMTSDELATCLSEEIAANDLVVVDVTDAEFVDVSFVHNMLRADRLALEKGSRFTIQMGTAPIVRRVIEVSGVFHRLHWASSREEALEDAPAGVATAAPPCDVRPDENATHESVDEGPSASAGPISLTAIEAFF